MNRTQRLIKVYGFGRIAFGAALVLAPRRSGGLLAGPDGERPGVVPLTRGFGAREVALGAAVLVSADDPARAAQLMRFGAGCDAVDTIAILKTSALPALPRYGGAAVGLAAGVAGVLFSSAVRAG